VDPGVPQVGWIVAAALAAALLSLAVRAGVRRVAASWRARHRAHRALRGERRAEGLLEGLGYHILERQPATTWAVEVDGQPEEVHLRADLLVERGGTRLVAEVKTGARAPRLQSSATRRQLLEYRVAYDVDGVLLVDAEAGAVREVTFPGVGREGRAGAGRLSASVGWMVLGGVVGAALAAALLY